MSIVSFSDYFFSFKRGAILGNIKSIVLYALKSSVLNFYSFLFSFTKKRSYQISEVKKVGVYIPATAGMGDLVMSQLFFRDLRSKMPDAVIILYSRFNQIIQKSFINEVVNIQSLKLKDQLEVLNRAKFDLIIFPEKSFVGASLFVKVKCNFKVGYLNSYQVKSNFLNKDNVDFNPIKQHYFLKSYSLYKYMFGISNETPKYIPDLKEWPTPKSNINQNYVVLIPKVQWENRSIPYNTLVLIIQEILKSDFLVILAGGDESKSTNEKLILQFACQNDKIVYKQDLLLDELSGIIRESSGVICGDSGPMHLAFGFQRPVLSFWGPTFPQLRLPEIENSRLIAVFEKEKCRVENCYNMEFKPFCKTCLRLDNISNVPEIVQKFLNSL